MRARARTYLFLGFDVRFVRDPWTLVAIVTAACHAMARAAPTAADVERDRELRALIVAAASQPSQPQRNRVRIISHRHHITPHIASQRNRTAHTTARSQRCAGARVGTYKSFGKLLSVSVSSPSMPLHTAFPQLNSALTQQVTALRALTARHRTSEDPPRLLPVSRSL
jgi:hypothetical protein